MNEVNEAFGDSVSFVFLPGDVADDGSRSADAVVRGELDRLGVVVSVVTLRLMVLSPLVCFCTSASNAACTCRTPPGEGVT
ncbi:hypothetical protein [Granulicella sp. dw_53]|uniref:hypothetical protein n=1 Tax=Granulicella sp. dw_53 TaxID=2719792 RepID=UPI001BD20ADA|nr:hypothetical protein [Granulicella sp. dw_53]